jgi:hypothetical protein
MNYRIAKIYAQIDLLRMGVAGYVAEEAASRASTEGDIDLLTAARKLTHTVPDLPPGAPATYTGWCDQHGPCDTPEAAPRSSDMETLTPIIRPVPRMTDALFAMRGRPCPWLAPLSTSSQRQDAARGKTAAEVAADYAKTQALAPERFEKNNESVEYAKRVLAESTDPFTVSISRGGLEALTRQAENWSNRNKPGAFQ